MQNCKPFIVNITQIWPIETEETAKGLGENKQFGDSILNLKTFRLNDKRKKDNFMICNASLLVCDTVKRMAGELQNVVIGALFGKDRQY